MFFFLSSFVFVFCCLFSISFCRDQFANFPRGLFPHKVFSIGSKETNQESDSARSHKRAPCLKRSRTWSIGPKVRNWYAGQLRA